jgi:hypothetical protein
MHHDFSEVQRLVHYNASGNTGRCCCNQCLRARGIVCLSMQSSLRGGATEAVRASESPGKSPDGGRIGFKHGPVFMFLKTPIRSLKHGGKN